MAIELGMTCGGVVLPGTERVVRDTDAMWRAGDRGTRPRAGMPPDLLVGHWTAGPPRDGPPAGSRVYRAMRARLGRSGRPLDVGIHLVIGWDGLIHQTCDLATATVHVGHRGIIARSVGIECCWPGTAEQAERLGVSGRVQRVSVAGRTVRVLSPSPEMLAAWRWLAETLAEHLPIPRQAPLDRDGRPLADRMTHAQARSWRGAMEHLHAPGSTKIDAAGLLVDALGWRGVVV